MSLESKFLIPDEVVNLSNCDREPIHIPGSIQPRGALLVFHDGSLIQYSRNLESLTGLNPEEILGKPLTDLFNKEALELSQLVFNEAEKYAHPLKLELKTGPFTVVPHRIDGLLVLELEPSAANNHEIYQSLRLSSPRLSLSKNQHELCQVMADEVRKLIDFDRVMVYKFDSDWHGEVIAEARSDSAEAFLGLHFPATDIPVQARRLYTQNWIRHIADVDYQAVALEPYVNPHTQEPLDMSYSFLRSVSPIHIEYLKNMGVGASLSISLIKDEKLWGLIACHHESPKTIAYETLSACEFLGQVFSMQLSTKLDSDHFAQELKVKEALLRCIKRVAAGENFLQDLADCGDDLLTLAAADGVAISHNDEFTCLGKTPPNAALKEFISWLKSSPKPSLFVTDRLRDVYPNQMSMGERFAGLMAIAISQTQAMYLIWFRPEVIQTVSWGGKPEKLKEGETLRPRSSFAAWQESVRCRSLSWQNYHLSAVSELRNTLINAVFRYMDDLNRLNRELERSNAELDSFAYIASHDLKEPLRGIHNYASFLLEDYEAQLDQEGVEQLHTLVSLSQRMEDLINSLLHFSRVGRVDLSLQETSPNELVDEVKELLVPRLKASQAELRVENLPIVFADRVRLREVFNNLITNALKYNSSSPPVIQIGSKDRPGQAPLFFIKDNGIGVPAKHQADIFKLFKRLHAKNAYGGGTGMGLTIVKKIIERHGGKIWLESDEEGTTFYFTLSPEETL